MNEEKNDYANETKSEIKKLSRSRKNKYIFGVCGGVAEYMEIDASIVRILWVISVFIGGAGLAAYLVAAILMPQSEEDEKEISKEKTSRENNVGLIVGGILILFGLLILLDHLKFVNFNFWGWNFTRFVYFPWDFIWPLALIFLGIFIAIGRPRREKILQRAKGKELSRSRTNRKISGICGGLGEYFSIDPTLIRIAWVIISLVSGIILGIIVYFIFVLIVPEEPIQEL